jgi:hypothetical protein
VRVHREWRETTPYVLVSGSKGGDGIWCGRGDAIVPILCGFIEFIKSMAVCILGEPCIVTCSPDSDNMLLDPSGSVVHTCRCNITVGEIAALSVSPEELAPSILCLLLDENSVLGGIAWTED